MAEDPEDPEDYEAYELTWELEDDDMAEPTWIPMNGVIPDVKSYPVPTFDEPAHDGQRYPDWTRETSKVVRYSARRWSTVAARRDATAVYGRVYEWITDGEVISLRVPRRPA